MNLCECVIDIKYSFLTNYKWLGHFSSYAGCPAVEGFDGTHLVFVGAGSDPYEVITNSVKLVCIKYS